MTTCQTGGDIDRQRRLADSPFVADDRHNASQRNGFARRTPFQPLNERANLCRRNGPTQKILHSRPQSLNQNGALGNVRPKDISAEGSGD